jgi:predicted AAA+ superfamily ATPase
MLEKLFKKYQYINKKILTISYKRYFFDIVDFNEKLIGIVGARGVGKTTFLLQYLEGLEIADNKKLYFSVDSIVGADEKLFDIAEEFSNLGGKVLVIDEIHKYKNFEIELKEIYDFLDIQVLFSGSSAIVLEHNKADLSRRAVLYRVKGLSFREFLELKLGRKFERYSLSEILENHIVLASDVSKDIKPLESFREYLKFGYYPFYFETPNTYYLKLEEIVNVVVESDLPMIYNIEPSNIMKLKQLVAYICNSKPYELNLTNLSSKIGINRKTLYLYIHYLTVGDIFMKVLPKTKGDTVFSKPSKLYLNNTNLNYAYCGTQEVGTLRESFFVNQLDKNYKIEYSKIGDFLVDDKFTVEIGGKNKSFKQIKDVEDSFVIADDIEVGFGNKIPLWLFGFLY